MTAHAPREAAPHPIVPRIAGGRFFAKVRGHLEVSWWWTPLLCVGAAIGLALLMELLDARIDDDGVPSWYQFTGTPAAAREILGVIASSMMTFTGLVFSVTVLVLQQTSSQFSPRVLRTFLKDRQSQLVLGTFVGTFVYSLLGLRSIHTVAGPDEGRVSSLTVWLGVLLAVACVGAFIFYIHHISQSIRAVVVIGRIAADGRGQLDQLYPEGVGDDSSEASPRRPSHDPTLVIPNLSQSGVVEHVDEDTLFQCATGARVVVGLVPQIGDFVSHGSPLFEVWGDPADLDQRALVQSINIAAERSAQQDLPFALRELVDIAERALSPGVNDPTTAVQVIDQIHDLMRRLVRRRFPDPFRVDDQGNLALVLPRPDWDGILRLACDEIRRFGAGSMQIPRRLRLMLEDLRRAAPDFRRREIDRQLALLDRSVAREMDDPEDRAVALRPSAQGHAPS